MTLHEPDTRTLTKLHCKLPLIYTSRSRGFHTGGSEFSLNFYKNRAFCSQARQVIECLHVLKTIETAATNIRFRLKRKSATISFLYESIGNGNQKKYQTFLHSIFELIMCAIVQ